MGKIRKLSALEAQQIAAGEVVERPANVVKELVENALDAGATELSVFIEQGGQALIRCIDNGSGMSAEDVRLSIEHHATSKFGSIDDLSAIGTFGFRGEALSAIAAVSRMQLATCLADQQVGTLLEIESGVVENERAIARPQGTDIAVRDLFYALPARQRFLRKKETEFRAIQTMVSALALSRFDVAFSLWHDEKSCVHWPIAQNRADRVAAVLGSSFAAHMQESGACGVIDSLFLATPAYQRYDRSSIFVFVNGRWIKNGGLVSAFVKGFERMLPAQKYPAGVLFVQVEPAGLDINVHPRKEEVLLRHPRTVEMAIESVVRTLLDRWARSVGGQVEVKPASHTVVPILPHAHADRLPPAHVPPAHVPPAHVPATRWSSIQESSPWETETRVSETRVSEISVPAAQESKTGGSSTQVSSTRVSETQVFETHACCAPAPVPKTHDTSSSFSSVQAGVAGQQRSLVETHAGSGRVIGQLFLTYILVERGAELLLVDQHAAAERILYEKFVRAREQVTAADLVVSQFVDLPESVCAALVENQAVMERYGFRFDSFSSTRLVVRAIPGPLGAVPLADILNEIGSELYSSQESPAQESPAQESSARAAVSAGQKFSAQAVPAGQVRSAGEPGTWLGAKIHHTLCARMACKAAIKAGDRLSFNEMQTLVDQWQALSLVVTCPHGRPACWVMTEAELERLFRRAS